MSQPGAAEQFLRHFLPADVTALLDLAQLQPVKDSFVDETLQEHFSDLMFEAPLRGQDKLFVCLLFEHKSRVDPLAPLQVLRYMVQGWESMLRQRGRLHPILPVVVYHGLVRWGISTDFQGLFNLPEALQPYTPAFQHHLSDLSAYSDEELKRMAELGVGLLVLKHIFRPELRPRLPEVLALWYIMRRQPQALGYLEAILHCAKSKSTAEPRKAQRKNLRESASLSAQIRPHQRHPCSITPPKFGRSPHSVIEYFSNKQDLLPTQERPNQHGYLSRDQPRPASSAPGSVAR